MSDKLASIDIKPGGPSYVEWRSELLGELALARVPDLIVMKPPDRSPTELPFDFWVTTEDGLAFFVTVKGFSSIALHLRNAESIPELRWPLDADWLRRAHANHCPALLFLFDADTNHGRFLRIDTLPNPDKNVKRLTIRFPVENTINKESVERLVAELRGECTQ